MLLIGAGLGIVIVVAGLLIAGHIEENDSFCASCHTQPESIYYQRTQAPTSIDLASFHAAKNVACIDCHSGPGTAGRVGAITLVALPDLVAFVSNNYRSPAVVTKPIGDANCLKCHADISQARTFNNHFHYFLPRWQAVAAEQAATCVECHQAHPTGGPANIAFLPEASTRQVCQRCHSVLARGN